MASEGRLSVEELKVLNEELAILTNLQSEARLNEIFIRMTTQEIKDFDVRKARISYIYAILWKHDAERS